MRAFLMRALDHIDARVHLRASILLALLVIGGQTWWTIALDRQSTLDTEQRNGLGTVRLLEAHAALSFQNGTDKLETIATTVRTMSATEEEVRGIVLAHDLSNNPYLSALHFVNKDGMGWFSAANARTGSGTARGFDFVPQLLSKPESRQLYVGKPYRTSYDGQLVVPLARNLFDDEGRRVGVLAVDVRLAFFDAIYAPVARANAAVVTLFADAGHVILETPQGATGARHDVSGANAIVHTRGGPDTGQFRSAAFRGDGIERLYSFHRVGSLPLTLAYGRALDTILAPWQARTWNRVAFSGAVFAVFCGLAFLVAAQVRRLQESERNLRRAQEELRALNTGLEERIAQRTAKLEQSNQELAVALSSLKLVQGELFRAEKMAALGSLVAGVAHELNTPVGIGVTMASSLQDSARDMSRTVAAGRVTKTQLDEWVRGIEHGSEILLRSMERAASLIQSFKQVAVDQSGNERRRFDLRKMVQEIVYTHAPLYRKTAFQLEQSVPENITMDSYPGALGQVLVNFLNNAILHAFDGRTQGLMRISARLLGTDQVEITFSDDGCGIKPDHLKRVFDPFFTTKLGQGGSGLGMHIVYNLVTDILKGSVSIESAPGNGTKLVLILPLQVEAKTTQASGSEQKV
jgi:signal transduction histidine kinase